MLCLHPSFVGSILTTKWLVGKISGNVADKMICGSNVAHKAKALLWDVSICEYKSYIYFWVLGACFCVR